MRQLHHNVGAFFREASFLHHRNTFEHSKPRLHSIYTRPRKYLFIENSLKKRSCYVTIVISAVLILIIRISQRNTTASRLLLGYSMVQECVVPSFCTTIMVHFKMYQISAPSILMNKATLFWDVLCNIQSSLFLSKRAREVHALKIAISRARSKPHCHYRITWH